MGWECGRESADSRAAGCIPFNRLLCGLANMLTDRQPPRLFSRCFGILLARDLIGVLGHLCSTSTPLSARCIAALPRGVLHEYSCVRVLQLCPEGCPCHVPALPSTCRLPFSKSFLFRTQAGYVPLLPPPKRWRLTSSIWMLRDSGHAVSTRIVHPVGADGNGRFIVADLHLRIRELVVLAACGRGAGPRLDRQASRVWSRRLCALARWPFFRRRQK